MLNEIIILIIFACGVITGIAACLAYSLLRNKYFSAIKARLHPEHVEAYLYDSLVVAAAELIRAGVPPKELIAKFSASTADDNVKCLYRNVIRDAIDSIKHPYKE